MGKGKGTGTGNVFEAMIETALKENHYTYKSDIPIGEKLFGGVYKADFVVNGIIISCKWQQVGGTAEQKILYEIASLIKIIRENPQKFSKAYVVIGGRGFSKKFKESLLSQKHRKVLKNGDLVDIVEADYLVEKLNKKEI